MDTTIQREKLEQAVGILDEQGIDCWLTFVRETSETPDPALKLILGFDVTWQSALLVTRGGKRIAVVGRGDGELLRSAGLYETVLTYDENITPVLRTLLRDLDPQQIAVNYALGDVASDGLTHGMYLQLASALRRTPYLRRLISAAPVIGSLRSRKTATELARMQRALDITLELFTEVTAFLRPGRSEREVADLLHGEIKRRGLETSWEWDYCPIVGAGAASGGGHSGPTDNTMRAGDLVHLDFGVAYEGYRADLQRMWYLRSARGSRSHLKACGRPSLPAPEPSRRRAKCCARAFLAGRWTLRPGSISSKAGYPEYKHALGHSVGLATHDGGPLIGPRWPRYGETPERAIEPGSVYTLELGTQTERGYIGLEDEVLVTAQGADSRAAAKRVDLRRLARRGASIGQREPSQGKPAMNIDLGSVEVVDNKAERRYEAEVNGELAVVEYHLDGDRIVFRHTEVPTDLEGHGLAAKLAQTVLDDARARHLMVVPICPIS